MLGKLNDLPENYEKGEVLLDTAMDLETNVSKGFARENSLLLRRGPVSARRLVKMAQTFRSGTNDIDALDFADCFWKTRKQIDPDGLNESYVLVNFRPAVTKKNWRMDCGVAGYDNTFGLPPFFPTRLRFEDYIYRLWIQQDGIAAAHVDAAQNHTKSNYMRNPAAAEIFNEEVSNLLKRKIKDVTRLDELGIAFDYEGEVTADDARTVLDKVAAMYAGPSRLPKPLRTPARRPAPIRGNLQKAFYGFEPDFFHQNLLRIVDDVVDDQGVDRALADPDRDLLLREGPPGPSPRVRNHSKQVHDRAVLKQNQTVRAGPRGSLRSPRFMKRLRRASTAEPSG